VTGPAQRPIEDALAIAGSAAETVQRALTAVVVEVSFTVGTTSGPELWRVRRLSRRPRRLGERSRPRGAEAPRGRTFTF